MLKPAILFKEELQKGFNNLRYSEEAMYYNGCGIEDGNLWIEDSQWSEGVIQYAILDGDKVVGFISWRVDYYSSNAYNFGLVSFNPNKPSLAIAMAVKEAINIIRGERIRRCEFGAVQGNPAVNHYDRITNMFRSEYIVDKLTVKEAFKDRKGVYHDRYIYVLIRKET